MSSGLQLPAQDPDCVLKFDAVVTSLNGKSKEAFYTEFFVVKEDLESVMFKGGVDLAAYPTIATYSELWARSRKIPFCIRECKNDLGRFCLIWLKEAKECV